MSNNKIAQKVAQRIFKISNRGLESYPLLDDDDWYANVSGPVTNIYDDVNQALLEELDTAFIQKEPIVRPQAFDFDVYRMGTRSGAPRPSVDEVNKVIKPFGLFVHHYSDSPFGIPADSDEQVRSIFDTKISDAFDVSSDQFLKEWRMLQNYAFHWGHSVSFSRTDDRGWVELKSRGRDADGMPEIYIRIMDAEGNEVQDGIIHDAYELADAMEQMDYWI